jgi:pimeloyl-ACP methyl ester carboxylesterase
MVILFIVTFLILILVASFLIIKNLFQIEELTLNEQTRLSLPGQFIQLQKGITHFEIQGGLCAPVVVLVHGFSTPYYIWDPTFEALIAAGFRVLRFDLFGRGFSDRPHMTYDGQLCISQLAQLLNALEIKEPVHLVGLSYGGLVAAGFAIQFPELIHSLTLLDPLVTTAALGKFQALNIPFFGEMLMAFYLEPFVLPKSQLLDFYQPEKFPNWENRYRHQMRHKGFSRAILSTFRNIRKMATESEYQAIGKTGVPVLGIWGEQDQTISREDMRLLESWIPQMRLLTIKNAWHIPHYEQPDSVNPLLIAFLKKNNSIG